MGKRKLNDAETAELRKAYEAWNPHDPNGLTAEELADQFGISKQTMYNMRAKWLAADRERTERANAGTDLEPVVSYLTEQLVTARAKILELERIIEQIGGML